MFRSTPNKSFRVSARAIVEIVKAQISVLNPSFNMTFVAMDTSDDIAAITDDQTCKYLFGMCGCFEAYINACIHNAA